MEGMSMTSSSSDGMATGTSMPSMSVIFTSNHGTPLFSSQWTPSSTGGYAGTCIFLIVLAIVSRVLLATRNMLERKWHDKAINRRYVVVAGETEADKERQALGRKGAEKTEEATLTTRGLDERVKVVRTPRRSMEGVPWRFSTDLPRACIFTVQAGVLYLLMLAVMTLNVGYFLSVLAGLFIGELAVGRYARTDDYHH